MPVIPFNPGETYTRDEIYDRTGGPPQGMLPTVFDRVVSCCITRELKDNRLLIADVPHQLTPAKQWSKGQQAVPLFLKREPGKWEYMGDFRVASTSNGEEPKVKMILHLTPAAPGSTAEPTSD